MSIQKNIPTRAWAEMALLSLIWGASFLAFAVALTQLDVFTTVAFRIGGGAIILWVFILIRRLTIPSDPKIWLAFAVMGVLNNIIPFSLIAWRQTHIESGLASILNGSTAVIGVLAAAVFFADERLTTRKVVGVSLGFLGVIITIGISNLTGFNPTSLAQLAILGASSSYACAGVWARKALHQVSPQIAAAGMTGCAAVIMVPLALITDGMPTFDYSAATWVALTHLALFATAGAYLLYYRILIMAGAGNLMLVTLTVIPVAIILGAWRLGETLSAQAYFGFALLALGLLVLDGRLFGKK